MRATLVLLVCVACTGGDAGAPEVHIYTYPTYPTDRTQSPITLEVAERLQSIAAREARNPRVFLKVGDSNTADGAFLRCFDFPMEGPIELGDHGDLEPTIEWFYGSGTQISMTAVPGMRATDVVTGEPSALDTTLSRSPARYALVMYGTNQEPLDRFEHSMREIVEKLESRGVIPIFYTIPWCGACTMAPNTPFNDIVRRIAEEHSIPLIDQRREMDKITNGGLSQDDIHFSVYDRGCSFTPVGLQFGFNLRNLLTYEALMRVRATLEEGAVWDP